VIYDTGSTYYFADPAGIERFPSATDYLEMRRGFIKGKNALYWLNCTWLQLYVECAAALCYNFLPS